ncbi:hypothetical protein IQ06DRAFT_99170 [Phaeosphaeriaceae sp. SRC1lsM3a]|nr:hypothetical protein IQ06DRAFT_99170 [Stagonospora sp. SRC1lsM3a]
MYIFCRDTRTTMVTPNATLPSHHPYLLSALLQEPGPSPLSYHLPLVPHLHLPDLEPPLLQYPHPLHSQPPPAPQEKPPSRHCPSHTSH